MEKHVVEQKEKETPFQERKVKSLESFFTKRPRIRQILKAEEITSCYEEQGHMKRIDEISQEFRCLRMAHHHKDYGYSFGN